MMKKSFFGTVISAVGNRVLAMLGAEPMYNTGGSNGGSQLFYRPRNGGPNANIHGGFGRMRAYSRDLTRKIPEIDDGLDTRAASIIGVGIRAIPRHTDPQIKQQIKNAWLRWGETADFDGADIDTLDRLILRERDEAGEVFIREIRTIPINKYDVPIRFQLLESEMLDHTYNTALKNGAEIIAGIEYDATGRRIAYHFFKKHPNDLTFGNNSYQRVRVPANEICHYYRKVRAGQGRGSPRAYTGHMQMRDLMIYEENELTRKINVSAVVGTITSTTSNAMAGMSSVSTFEKSDSKGPTGTNPNLITKGTVSHLYPDEKYEETKAADTDPNYPAYVKGKNRTNAKAMGMSYASYSGDLSDNSYSGIRAGQNLEDTKYQVEQKMFICQVKMWVWRKWMDAAVLAGVLNLPNYGIMREEYQAVTWQGPGTKYINPLQEINAVKVELELGIISEAEAAAARGRDIDEVYEQRAHEIAMKKQLGIK